MALLIHRSDVDGKTGATRFQVRIHEVDPKTGEVTLGPVEHVVIYPQALANILSGETSPEGVRRALKKWLAPRHVEMLLRKKHIDRVTSAAAELHGQVLEFKEGKEE